MKQPTCGNSDGDASGAYRRSGAHSGLSPRVRVVLLLLRCNLPIASYILCDQLSRTLQSWSRAVRPEISLFTPGEGGGGVYSYSADTIEGPRAPAVKLTARHSVPGPRYAGRERGRERERESFIRNNLHDGVVSGAGNLSR